MTTESSQEPGSKVYGAIARVSSELAKIGIEKGRKNLKQDYVYRSIDDVLNVLGPTMAKHGLVVVPSYTDRIQTERIGASGRPMIFTTLVATFCLVCVEDASRCYAGPFYGEAMDSADKSTNKAMSAAYKYFALLTFAIPVDGTQDADAGGEEVAAISNEEVSSLIELINAASSSEAIKAIKDGVMDAGKLALWDKVRPHAVLRHNAIKGDAK